MSAGLVALLDDIATLVKLSAASLDDVAAGVGKASAKAMGAVIDDAAVTPQYVAGINPRRELPIVGRIALGSIRNKLLLILPLALLLSQFAPWALTPILMLGGTYLVFEGGEKVLEALRIIKHHNEHDAPRTKDEKKIVSSAVRTDLILSAEIMVIALNEVAEQNLLNRALILLTVAIAMTVVVYGAVALIVKMDDAGLALAKRPSRTARTIGRGLVKAMPIVMSVLTKVGTIAMLWVGGHILLSGLNELGLHAPHQAIHHLTESITAATGPAGPFLAWCADTAAACAAGLIVGSIVALAVVAVQKVRARTVR